MPLRRAGLAALVALTLLAGAACDDSLRRAREGGRATSSEAERDARKPDRSSARPQGRPATTMNLNTVRFVTRGPAEAEEERRIARAVRDLRRLGYWKELTTHVVRVVIAGRPGEGRVPKDGRLAQALMTLHTTGPYPGSWCEIAIFSRALEEDIARQAVYYSEGRLAVPPPTLRQFWAVILAHELAHCSPRGQKGEGYSTDWEARVLAAFGRARVGSPS